MNEVRNPAQDFNGSVERGLDQATGKRISRNGSRPVFVRVGGNEYPEAPSGEYIARCTKVDPEFRFMNNRKLALYFTITEGIHTGKRARLFYNKLDRAQAEQAGTDFGVQSKFYKDLVRLFPDLVGDDAVEIDPVDSFYDKEFRITVRCSDGKNQATVSFIEHTDAF